MLVRPINARRINEEGAAVDAKRAEFDESM